MDLVVSHGAVKEPIETSVAKCIHARVVTAWDWEDGHQGNLVQAYVVDTESPFEERDVVAFLLMRLRIQESFRHPCASINYVDIPHVNEGSNMLLYYLGFSGSVIDGTACNGCSISSIDVVFVTDDGEANTIGIENPPMAGRHVASLKMFP